MTYAVFAVKNISRVCIWKKLLTFAKATHIFFSNNTCGLDIELTRTVNILTINELVKLTMLGTTGPRYRGETLGEHLVLHVLFVKTFESTKRGDSNAFAQNMV